MRSRLLAAFLIAASAVALVAGPAGAVPRGYWQKPASIAAGFRGLIHPVNGRHFADVFAHCSGVGASYYSRVEHGVVFQRFYCHYVISYVERVPDDDCSGIVVLFNGGGILRDKLTDDRCR